MGADADGRQGCEGQSRAESAHAKGNSIRAYRAAGGDIGRDNVLE